jgi:uncharacterized protein YjiS (DUF1127 family)
VALIEGVMQMTNVRSSMRAAYQSFIDFRTRYRAVRDLSAMDDVFLKDIGIGRSEIHSVVREPR